MGPHKFLRVDWHTSETSYFGDIFCQSVFHHAEIEAGDDHVIPMIGNSAQGYIQYGYNPMSEGLMAIEYYCAEEFLALRITGVVSAGVKG